MEFSNGEGNAMSHGEATGNQVERTGGGSVALLKYAAIILLIIGPLCGVPFFLDDPLAATRGALRNIYALLVLFDIVVGFVSILLMVRLSSATDFESWKKLGRWASAAFLFYVACLIGGLLIADAYVPSSYFIKICLYFCLAFMAAKVVSLLLAQDEERRFFRQSFKPLLMKYSANAGVGVFIGVLADLLRRFIVREAPFGGSALHFAALPVMLFWWLVGIVSIGLIILLMTWLSRAVNLAFVDAHGLIGQTLFDRDVTLAWADLGPPRHKRFLQHDYLLVPAAAGRPTIWLQAPIHQSEDFRAAVRKYAPPDMR